MTETQYYAEPDPMPVYVLLVLAIGMCIYFFFVGFTCVRVWFYKGALGPVPEKFLIIPLHRKKQHEPSHVLPVATGVANHNKRTTMFPHITETNKPKTVVPHIAKSAIANPFSDDNAIPNSRPYFTTIPAINIEDVDESGIDGFGDFPNPEEVRKYIAEERRISRLPTFEQDDCGDGNKFSNVPYATEAVQGRRLPTDATLAYLEFRILKTISMGSWLAIDRSRNEMLMEREKLLDRKRPDCVQVRLDGEEPCEKLLDQVVQHLCIANPNRFSILIKFGKRHVRDGAIYKDFSLERPFEYHPLELCARLAGADFTIFVKDAFTRRWYLQASATLFPAGWHMSKHVGKSVDAIANSPQDPVRLWLKLPDILDIVHASPSALFSRTSTFIQTLPTHPPNPPLTTILFTQRPMDLFSGSIANLVPPNLHVRREFQNFRVVPDSGAIVMTTRTEFKALVRMIGRDEKEELMEEIHAWTDEEAIFKGKDLWIRAVRSWCEGGEAFRDDVTVFDGGG